MGDPMISLGVCQGFGEGADGAVGAGQVDRERGLLLAAVGEGSRHRHVGYHYQSNRGFQPEGFDTRRAGLDVVEIGDRK